MGRLFRDWRFALFWVVGISFMASAFVSDNDGYEQSLARLRAQAPIPANAAVARATSQPHPAPAKSEPAEELAKFGEPLMDTAPFDPNPLEPAPAASAVPAGQPSLPAPLAP
jgi:hypothetical protein